MGISLCRKSGKLVQQKWRVTRDVLETDGIYSNKTVQTNTGAMPVVKATLACALSSFLNTNKADASWIILDQDEKKKMRASLHYITSLHLFGKRSNKRHGEAEVSK